MRPNWAHGESRLVCAPRLATKPHHSASYQRLCRMLKKWREDADLTQRSLATRLKKPHSFVYKVETGQRRIDPTEFVVWCRGCGIDPAAGWKSIE